ncbi:hypothetical protein ACJX0J_037803, partial [Zea mays]
MDSFIITIQSHEVLLLSFYSKYMLNISITREPSTKPSPKHPYLISISLQHVLYLIDGDQCSSPRSCTCICVYLYFNNQSDRASLPSWTVASIVFGIWILSNVIMFL